LGLRHYFTVTIRNFTVLVGLSMDHPEPMSVNFQDPATAIAEGIIDLHNDIMTFLVPIFIFVCYFLLRIVYLFAEKRNQQPVQHINHHTLLEVV